MSWLCSSQGWSLWCYCSEIWLVSSESSCVHGWSSDFEHALSYPNGAFPIITLWHTRFNGWPDVWSLPWISTELMCSLKYKGLYGRFQSSFDVKRLKTLITLIPLQTNITLEVQRVHVVENESFSPVHCCLSGFTFTPMAICSCSSLHCPGTGAGTFKPHFSILPILCYV